MTKPPERVPESIPKIHFPGLNGLRFLAAFMVVIYHVEQVKNFYHLDCLGRDKFWGACFTRLGGLGVMVFFVLSGFLITYLLLTEYHHTNTIRLKNFYFRRALRIWPVYFLLTGLSFFFFPYHGLFYIPNMPSVIDAYYWRKFALYMALTAHLASELYQGVPFGNALWSASVEEHFYFFWPLMIRTLKGRIVPALLVIVLVLVPLKQLFFIWYWIDPHATKQTLIAAIVIGHYFDFFKIDCMAMGALGAVLYCRRSRLLKVLYHRATQAAVLLITVFCLARGVSFGVLDDDIYSIFFLLIILNVATNPWSLLKLENRACDFLGRISYGLYAYNWVAIVITINGMRLFGLIHNVYLRNLYIYTVSICLLIALASVSYYLMERMFLRLKVRYGSVSASNMPNPVFPDSNSREVAKCI